MGNTPAPEAVVETPVPAETAEPSEETPVEQSTEEVPVDTAAEAVVETPEVPVLAAMLSSVDVDNVLEASGTPSVVEPAQTSIKESQEDQETEKLDEPEKPVVKKPALPSKKKSKVVAKKPKAAPAKKQPKTLGAPKKKPTAKKPKLESKLTRGKSLEELEEASNLL